MEGLIVPGIFAVLLAIAGLVLLALDTRDRRREQRNKSK
jgi:hypothetical protein